MIIIIALVLKGTHVTFLSFDEIMMFLLFYCLEFLFCVNLFLIFVYLYLCLLIYNARILCKCLLEYSIYILFVYVILAELEINSIISGRFTIVQHLYLFINLFLLISNE